MQGKVKWFSEEKGYGYIVADDGKEHYFNVREVQGINLPRNGDTVSFESIQGKSGPKASAVTIVSKAQSHETNRGKDDRVTCNKCQKKMVPRLIIKDRRPRYSVCPFCGSTYKDFGWCFIATAIYGGYDTPQVLVLRRFRDESLGRFALGRAFIICYYKISPSIANYLLRKPLPASIVRRLLNIFVRWYSNLK
ncbi:MAG: cold shock domain-containing protein [Proteobacteria bacterium]|nr:cold shock domain-containing protein [Pseudomonadota bacterium]